jgi:hypothetical protein
MGGEQNLNPVKYFAFGEIDSGKVDKINIK